MQTVFRNEKKYIIFWTIWGVLSLLSVRWMITDPIVKALDRQGVACESR